MLRQNCRITIRLARSTSAAVSWLRSSAAREPPRLIVAIDPPDHVVVAGREVGVHERDRRQVLVACCLVGAALDVTRHQGVVASGHRPRQLLHLGVVHGDDLVVAPIADRRRVGDEFEAARLPSRQVGRTAVADRHLDRSRALAAIGGSEVQRRVGEHLDVPLLRARHATQPSSRGRAGRSPISAHSPSSRAHAAEPHVLRSDALLGHRRVVGHRRVLGHRRVSVIIVSVDRAIVVSSVGVVPAGCRQDCRSRRRTA